MNLFFDSGATKCDCIVTDEAGRYLTHNTDTGINASYASDEELDAVLARFSAATGTQAVHIVFAGAGCGNPANADRVRRAIEAHYHAQAVEVESDLAGACRLLSRRQPCLTAILGTGAAACQYDGCGITEQSPSLGWMLGDEGSGTHLGKLLISHYLKGGLPPECREQLEREFGLDRSEVLRRVYRAPSPNLFFSQFAKFIGDNIDKYSELQILVDQAFDQFFQEQILLLSGHSTLPLHLMGSVAWHYQSYLREAANRYGVRIGTVAASPLQLIKG